MKSKFIKALVTGSVLMTANAFAGIQTVQTNTSQSYAKTKYPILFVHGNFGFSRLGSADFGLDYWYKILPNLASNGATVYASQLSPLNSTDIRGEQLIAQVEEVLAITGKEKVNLMGHSQGGSTTRYAAGIIPNKIASVTTIAGDHKGTKVVDFIMQTGLGASVVATFMDLVIGPAIKFAEGRPDLPNDTLASFNSVSTAGALAFNERFPNGIPTSNCGEGEYVSKGIYNYSWSGAGGITNVFDPDTLLVSLSPLAYGLFTSNDGFIGSCDSHFGKVIRDDYYLNHFDEVNQVLGLRGLFSPDPVSLFRQHANRLKQQGL